MEIFIECMNNNDSPLDHKTAKARGSFIIAIVLFFALCLVGVLTIPAISSPFKTLVQQVYKHKCGEDGCSSKVLSEGDVIHGEAQLMAMLHDRPQMSKFASRNDPIWTWTAHQFAGECTGVKLMWRSEPVHLPANIISCSVVHGTDGFIYLEQHDRNGNLIDGERLWQAAVFELYNCRSGLEAKTIGEQAKAGVLGESEYVKKITLTEYETAVLTQSFWRNKWLPQSFANMFLTDHGKWRYDCDSYEIWIKARSPEYLSYYKSQYYELKTIGH
jgi:hypothetical protein